MTTYVGIDIGADHHKAVILTHLQMTADTWRDARAHTITVKNTIASFQRLALEIDAAAQRAPPAIVCLESSGHYYSTPLASYLAARYPVHVAQGKAIHDARQRFFNITYKDDNVDALCMARLLYIQEMTNDPTGVHTIPYTDINRGLALRLLSRHYNTLQKQINATTARLRQITKAIFPEAEEACFEHYMNLAQFIPNPRELAELRPEEISHDHVAWRKHKARIINLARDTCGADPTPYLPILPTLIKQRSQLKEMQAEIKAAITDQVEAHPLWPIFETFPCANAVDAATILGTIGDISTTPTKASFRHRIGFHPDTRQTGKQRPNARLTRAGSRHARRTLHQWAIRTLAPTAPPNAFRDYFRRRKQRAPTKNALAATKGKLADTLWACLHHNTPYIYNGGTSQ